MAHEPTEDISGDIDPFAIADEPNDPTTADEEQTVETVVIKEIREYLKEQIALHNSFDAIEPAGEGIMSTQQQVQMHKQVVTHLRSIQNTINNKVKEN